MKRKNTKSRSKTWFSDKQDIAFVYPIEKKLKFEKKFFFFFWSAGVVDFHPLGAQISGTKEKFKNLLGDPNILT